MMKFLCGKKFYISLKARKRLLKMTSFFLAFVMFVSAIPLHNFVKAEGTAHETTTYDAASVKVVDEMKSLRTETTKTFKKLDGTYEVAYYDQPIHYVLDGKWVNIDNSLMDEGNDELGNQANDFKIKLPKQITENKQIKIKKDQYELSWNVVGIQKASSEVIEQELSKDIRILNDINQRIFYRDVFDGVDLEYLIEGDKVKENFIMKQYIEDFSVTMELSVKDLVLIEDESIKFVDEEGNTIFDISDYIMYDASGKLSSDISVSIIQKNESEYTLTLKPNDDFMKEASYPLVIDPTISIKNDETIKYIKDGFISGTTLNTTGNFLRVGNRDNVNNRTYIGVDLSLITDKPVITYARLELPQYILNGVVQNTCTSCQINVKEVPNITFGMLTDTTQPSSSEIEDYMNVNGNYFNYYWDISKLVQRWKHDGKTEGLLEISDQNNYTSKYIDFKSVEYDNIKPKISIGYVETVGLYDYWTYHSQSAGSAGAKNSSLKSA